jgi:pimeloyl-ACP methyl ester carboxylesterase
MPSRQLAAIQKSTIVRSLGVLERVAPAVGARWAERLWFTVPRAGGRRDRLAPPGRPFEVRVHGRTVPGETWGDGPPVYLVHGWGGWRGQLDAFAAPLAEAGHRVVAFDALGHGDADPGPAGPGRSTALELADSLAAVVAAHGPAAAVVAHSLGATATAYAMGEGLAVGRAVFVAPMADPLPYTGTFARRLGFGERTRGRMVRRIERRVGMPLSAFRVPDLARTGATPPLLLVHDRQDAETGWSDSDAIARAWPGARLVTTTGLGHRRILRDPAVVAEVAGFVGSLLTSPRLPADGQARTTRRLSRAGSAAPAMRVPARASSRSASSSSAVISSPGTRAGIPGG